MCHLEMNFAQLITLSEVGKGVVLLDSSPLGCHNNFEEFLNLFLLIIQVDVTNQNS